ncbi:MAG: hypothetical protein ACXVGR_12610 [Mycobacteriaceae bacterium]
MTSPDVPQLLNSADLALFQGSDSNWFLNAAGETIRSFCQWHIAPSITVTDAVPISPDGTIMLPSLYVTAVQSVTIEGLELDPPTYHPHQAGYIRRYKSSYFQWPLWPLESDQPFREYPSALARHAEVTYTHGYAQLPTTVAAVGLELATRAMEMPSGVATELAAGPNTIKLGALGIVLSDDQRRRLGPFALVRF